MTVVKAENVVKDYGPEGTTVHALRGVNLEFGGGDFAAIAGPSGSGKSTFLHLAGCLDTLTSGTMTVNGSDTGKMSRKQLALLRRRDIGFIFQAYNLIPVLSVEENISFPLTLLGVDRKELKERTAKVLHDVGLEGMEKRLPREMSGGQQQRAAVRIEQAAGRFPGRCSNQRIAATQCAQALTQQLGPAWRFSQQDQP